MFASVVWPKGRPPSDNPECGFNNELCKWLINGNTCEKIILIQPHQWSHFPFRLTLRSSYNHLHNLCGCDTDITLLTLLVTFPVIGVLAVLCIGVLVLQKLRLQTRLDDSCWWLINYSDIDIIRESPVWALKQLSTSRIKSAWGCVLTGVGGVVVCVAFREFRVYLSAPQWVSVGAPALSPIFPTTAMAWGTRRERKMSTPP